MPTDDTGVTELLRRASDGLTPDVDRLVSGGITRGRYRQRRARIGTAVATLAVIGVIGTLAAVVPHLGDPDSTSSELATEPTASEAPTETPTETSTETSTDTPTATPTETPTAPPPDVPVTLGVPAAEVPATVEGLVGLEGRVSAPTTHLDAREDKVVDFLVDGMITGMGLAADPDGTRRQCEVDARRLGGTCEDVENGGWLLTWGPTLADGTTCAGADLQRYGYDVYVTSCNSADYKDAGPLADLPPLDVDQLRAIVTSPVWFEQLSPPGPTTAR